ncbi:MAG TPA: discoidin domain-containing protein [Phycisphaerales bacterium]|nr:discoidin domain-containing protein [Phycisphaerales bacterium]
MCKKLMLSVLVGLVAGVIGNASAADISWSGAGTDKLWSTAENWDGDTVPGAGDDAIIEMDPGATIDDSVTANADNVRIADAAGSTGRLVMTGGTLTVHQTGGGGPGLWIANRGTGHFDMSGGTITAEHVYLPRNVPGQAYMTMTGGTVTTGQSLTLGLHHGEYGELNISGGTINVGSMFRCPDGGQAVLNMTGGTINVSGTFFIIRRGNSGGTTSGHVQLDGGTITVDDFEMDAQNIGRPATMDITGGTLIINGDKVDKIKNYIARGWITAFGSDGTGVNVGLAGSNTVVSAGLSWNPTPGDGATDVSVDASLNWSSGIHAVRHDLYFGTSFDDVNSATATNDPAGVYRGSQDVSTYETGGLEMNQTYYWRVDDIGAPPADAVSKGSVWQFTTEPFAYPVARENIIATASTSNSPDEGPENTVNGSGLSEEGHSTTLTDMWLSDSGEPGSAWIQYEFDRPYKIHQMLVWNYNGSMILTSYGLKEITVECSSDAADWTQLGNGHELAQASGAKDDAQYTTIAFDGPPVKYVKITANSNWGGGVFDRYGLSEVRFLYIPLHAREPQPSSGAENVNPEVTLSWRAGRQAAEHNLYISTDEQKVVDDIAPVSVVTEARDIPSLDLGQTYYWKVNEVNMAETPSVLEGQVWKFATSDFLVVDDFESYNDIPVEEGGNPVYLTWVDGFDNPATNGSTIGYVEAFEPSMESGIIHSGGLSVPFMYDNNMKFSEAVRTFNPSQDWTRHGIKVLSLYFHGEPQNSLEQMYVKVNGSKVVYDGDPADIKPTDIEYMERGMWKVWNIDLAPLGVDLQKITELAIGFGNENNLTAGGSGVVYFDDIRLYPSAPEPPEEIWLEAEAATTMGASWKLYDDPTSSGGRHIGSEDGDGDDNTEPPGVEWVASYDFTVTGGTYKMLFRAQQANSDSLWVRIPTATSQNLEDQDLPGTGWVRFDAIDVPRGEWGWDEVYSELSHGMQVFETMNYTLPAGANTLEIAKREDGVFLDAILITNDVD